jgi:uncharacterized protein YxjI
MRRRRELRQEERETYGRDGTSTRYQMRQKLISFGDDFYIKDEVGRNVFKVDCKVLRGRRIRDQYLVEVAGEK